MRTPFVVGNWKLHKTIAEALALVTELKNQLGAVRDVEVGVAPVFTAAGPVARRLEGSSIAARRAGLLLGGRAARGPARWRRRCSPTRAAAWVIVGHSERRQHFGDTDDGVGKKARAALAAGLGAIAASARPTPSATPARPLAVVDAQLDGGARRRRRRHARRGWSSPTSRSGPSAPAAPRRRPRPQEVHAHIRARLGERLGADGRRRVRIQYGGSVKPGNAEALMSEPDIDGALVGGASLEAADFVAIVKAARARN